MSKRMSLRRAPSSATGPASVVASTLLNVTASNCARASSLHDVIPWVQRAVGSTIHSADLGQGPARDAVVLNDSPVVTLSSVNSYLVALVASTRALKWSPACTSSVMRFIGSGYISHQA